MKMFCFLSLVMLSVSTMANSGNYPVVYGISPRFISEGHHLQGLKAIKKRLPEISDLGATIIWLQPITPPFEEDGHGYDVVDYKSVWDVLGTDEDLRELVTEAHKNNIKVMLDVVLNHSSFEHPWVKDIAARGEKSPYFDFYQHELISNIPYAKHFHSRAIGKSNFIFYFWEHLLNFNYDNENLRQYMLDVLSHWVVNFDIDGFRFDASWGPSSRRPTFYREISSHLRKLKPGIILMAEDMAGFPVHYKGTNHPHLKDSGFDWAYDWNNQDEHWISKWSFQSSDDQGETVFNQKDPQIATDQFLKAISFTQDTGDVLAVRYIENNDTPGFLRNHSIEESKFAAKIMFVLPGIPLIFYGQEAGNSHELFELPGFDPRKKMSSFKPELWKFYKQLIALRKGSNVLNKGMLTNLLKTGPSSVSFLRKIGSERVKVDLDFSKKTVKLDNRPI
jgi:glycosidase